MERRALGCLMSGAHLVLAAPLVVVIGFAVFIVEAVILEANRAQPNDIPYAIAVGVAIAAGMLFLVFVWAALGLFAIRAVNKAIADAQEGRFARASERLRALRDREVFLRLAGMGGGSFARIRVGEAYVFALHGLSDEALRIALEESRSRMRSGLASAAATVAAMAAADAGESDAWNALAPHVAKAQEDPAAPTAQGVLAGRGQAHVLALELAEAERVMALLEKGVPGGRPAALLRALVHAVRGEWDRADAALVAARATSPFGMQSKQPVPAFFQEPIDAMRAQIARERGDVSRAQELATALGETSPAHRIARIVVAELRGERAAAAGDERAVAACTTELDAIAAQWSFSPSTLEAVGLARARIEIARGQMSGGSSAANRIETVRAVLRPALASRHKMTAQRAHFYVAVAVSRSGDLGSPALFEQAAQIAPATWIGQRAAEKVAGPGI